jgi:hypothetical protein
MKIIKFFDKKKKNYIESIDINKIPEKELKRISDIAFSSGDLLNEDKKQILEDGRTLEQTITDSYKNAIKNEQASHNPKFHRTPEEQDLSFSFSEQYASKLKEMEETIYDCDEEVVKLKKSKKYASKFSREYVIEKCNKEIDAYNELKKFCYEKGKSGQLYFQDMWEYCHYNWNECFEFIESTKKYLDRLIKNEKN